MIGAFVSTGWVVLCSLVTIGEGLTSVAAHLPIEAGHRMFTIDTGVEQCDKKPIPDSLRVPGSLNLRVGDVFLLSDPIVTAYDKAGALIPRVPIEMLELDEGNNVLERDLQTDRTTYVAMRPGVKKFRFRGYCSGAENVIVDLFIAVRE